MKSIKIVFIIIGLVLIICVGYYLKTYWFSEPNEYNCDEIEYLNNKYDDEFTFVSSFGGGLEVKHTALEVKSQKYQDMIIAVGCTWDLQDNKKVNIQYQDNYIDCIYKEKYTDYIKTLLETYFDMEVEVIHGTSTRGTINNFNSNTTFQEYIQSPYGDKFFDASINYIVTDKQKIEKDVKKLIKDNNLNVSGIINFAKSKDDEKVSLSFFMNKDGSFREFYWSN